MLFRVKVDLDMWRPANASYLVTMKSVFERGTRLSFSQLSSRLLEGRKRNLRVLKLKPSRPKIQGCLDSGSSFGPRNGTVTVTKDSPCFSFF